MKKQEVIVSVTSDIATDQRIKRICSTLHEAGYSILVTGRQLDGSLDVDNFPCRIRRVRHWFNKGWLFYAEYNMRLLIFLLFSKFDILHSNDLDTLPANFLASRLKRKILIYDSHEFFTEVPELNRRKTVKRIWEAIENLIFPRLNHIITVSNSIAREYCRKYGKEIQVIRNLPEKTEIRSPRDPSYYGLPPGKKLVILQGTGINRERGAEEAVSSMKLVKDAVLIIAGRGDVIPGLKEQVKKYSLNDRIFFLPAMPYRELMQLTCICHAGLSLDKDTSLNYRFSLPNKLFDYIAAGIPVVASPLPEVKEIVEKYGIGLIIENHSPVEIAGKISKILYDIPRNHWKDNLIRASEELNWEREKQKLLNIYNYSTGNYNISSGLPY